MKWQQEHDNFTFIPVLSDPGPEDDWVGRTGLVHQAVLDDFASLAGWQVYACGAPAMTDVAKQTFVGERGLLEDETPKHDLPPAIEAGLEMEEPRRD